MEIVLNEISEALARGEMVKISSFGSFAVRKKGRRIGRNPKTGTEVPINPRRVLVFRASHVLKDHINSALRKQGSSDAMTTRLPDLFSTPPRPAGARRAPKSAEAFRTISEVADELEVPQHVLRFWESKFPQIKPLKRAGGRRYYRPDDVLLLRRIRQCLYDQGYTIKGVQKLLREGALKADEAPRAAPLAPAARVAKSETLRAELLEIRAELVALRDLLKKPPG